MNSDKPKGKEVMKVMPTKPAKPAKQAKTVSAPIQKDRPVIIRSTSKRPKKHENPHMNRTFNKTTGKWQCSLYDALLHEDDKARCRAGLL